MHICSKGDRVSQANYGPGTVTEANDHHTVIDFDAHGLRRFATRLVVLEPTAEPAPVRKRTRAKAVKVPEPVAQHQ